jgi:hypothetical protein
MIILALFKGRKEGKVARLSLFAAFVHAAFIYCALVLTLNKVEAAMQKGIVAG